ncbi:hypothetical protein MAP00_005505 [Monascus purpureus]|nr:hypothetical protein MAP00_005505 [Monascus purpureus]
MNAWRSSVQQTIKIDWGSDSRSSSLQTASGERMLGTQRSLQVLALKVTAADKILSCLRRTPHSGDGDDNNETMAFITLLALRAWPETLHWLRPPAASWAIPAAGSCEILEPFA